MHNMNMANTIDKKVLSFQGLRGFAIMLIILSHCDYILNDYGNNIFMYFGAFGVELFIMLSGFLAYYNFIFKETNKKIGLVLRNKLRKIYPLHIITLIVSLPLCITLFTGNEVFKNGVKLILNILLLNTWIPRMEFYFSFNSVSWYLALVVFFILITPIVINLLSRMNNNFLFIILFLIILGEFLWTYAVLDNSMSHWLIYVCPIVRSFDFINGAIVCKIIKESNKHSMIEIGTVGTLILSCGILYSSLNSSSGMYMVVLWVIPSILLIILLYLGKDGSRMVNIVFKNSILVFIGNISFELFLIHQLVIRYMRSIYNRIGLGKRLSLYILAIIISVVVSYCYKLISKRVQTWEINRKSICKKNKKERFM